MRLFTDAEANLAAQGVWPSRVSRIYLEALSTNTGVIFLGVGGMVSATRVGVIMTLAIPAATNNKDRCLWDMLAPGANNYRLQDYWMDASVSGEGVIRTVWQA